MDKVQEKYNVKNYIEGALWGALLGDVIGAHLQFDKDVNEKKINNAFKIIGGGMHKLSPGQPTDDSQLNFSICKGLIRGKGLLNLNFIAQQMANWFLSAPIDVGNTIRNSVPKACNMKTHQAHLCRKGAKQKSQKSQSNGSLMAITGLSIWCSKLKADQILEAIKQTTILTHPNQMVQLANFFYVLMMSYLLQNLNDQNRALNSFLFAKNKSSQLCPNKNFQSWISIIQKSFQDLSVLQEHVPIQKCSGWVRIGLSYSCYFLVKGSSFYQSIRYIISQKGDTDTNACIVGGLLGAFYGKNNLKMNDQIQIINKWRSNNNRRPDWLIPGKIINDIVQKLQQIRPKQLKMIGSSIEYEKKIQKNK